MRESRLPAPGVLVAAIIGVSALLCAAELTSAVVRVKSSREIIDVTGSARRSVHSDFIIWGGRITDRAPTLLQAYALLDAHSKKVQQYFTRSGIPRTQIFPLAVSTTAIHDLSKNENDRPAYIQDPRQPIIAYELSQKIEIRSTRVDAIARLGSESSEMIRNGIVIQVEEPQYIYSQMGSLKLRILAEAAGDARQRADLIARASGSRVGQLRYARMGVVQIEGLYDSEGAEDSGANDTRSIDKKVTAIVHAHYAIR
jgi:hypothetical protein